MNGSTPPECQDLLDEFLREAQAAADAARSARQAGEDAIAAAQAYIDCLTNWTPPPPPEAPPASVPAAPMKPASRQHHPPGKK